MKRVFVWLFCFGIWASSLIAAPIRYADLSYKDVCDKSQEILSQHACYNQITPEIAGRILERFLFELDPLKVYFLKSDIETWLSPKPEMLQEIVSEFSRGQFPQFEAICDKRSMALKRYEGLESFAHTMPKPNFAQGENFRDNDWATNIDQLLFRIRTVQAIEENVLARFEPNVRKQVEERFQKRKKMVLGMDEINHQPIRTKVISTIILKALAEALDSQTTYFTPLEAEQFLIAIQQRLFGIGVMFQDGIDGFTISELVDQGPAFRQGKLKVGDKIIEVNGEPVIGADIFDVVCKIRGKENTYVTLTVIREVPKKETLKIRIRRGEVIVPESRIETEVVKTPRGPIGHIHLRTFYQDETTSACKDVRKALSDMMKKEKLIGVILDVRGNPGGILQQAVELCGLFMNNALICSIKDKEVVYPFWNLGSEKIWDGPMVVLTDRMSASASEIVAQAFQDWGRGVIVGDDRTYGKGSFQTTSFPTDTTRSVNPKGEFKITRGRYYTASGKTPQLVGVPSDIEVESPWRYLKIGEEYSKYPLVNDQIPSYFTYESFFQEAEASGSLRDGVMRMLNKEVSSFTLQRRDNALSSVIQFLKKNSEKRLFASQEYQTYLKNLQNRQNMSDSEEEGEEKKPVVDFQLQEATAVLQDMVEMQESQIDPSSEAA